MKEAVNKKGQIMKIFRLKPLSVCETNSYIVASEENNCVLIDAPADPDYILGEIESHGLTLKKRSFLPTVILTISVLWLTL